MGFSYQNSLGDLQKCSQLFLLHLLFSFQITFYLSVWKHIILFTQYSILSFILLSFILLNDNEESNSCDESSSGEGRSMFLSSFLNRDERERKRRPSKKIRNRNLHFAFNLLCSLTINVRICVEESQPEWHCLLGWFQGQLEMPQFFKTLYTVSKFFMIISSESYWNQLTKKKNKENFLLVHKWNVF